MKAKRVSREEQLKLIMECRSSGLSDYQWCDEYSGWFYISCPVIWKSLFRSVFVHVPGKLLLP